MRWIGRERQLVSRGQARGDSDHLAPQSWSGWLSDQSNGLKLLVRRLGFERLFFKHCLRAAELARRCRTRSAAALIQGKAALEPLFCKATGSTPIVTDFS